MNTLFWVFYGFLSLRFVVAFFNWSSRPFLRPTQKAADYRLISILIPARNEAASIEAAINAVKQLKGVNYELLVLDDHSEDTTAALAMTAMEGIEKARLLPGKPLPAGWLGKSWACYLLAEAAKGDYLLFIDADVRLQTGAIEAALGQLQQQRVQALSVFPKQQMIGLGEWLTVPLMHTLLLGLLPLKMVKWFKQPSLAAANGQFMLFDADDYHQHQWHALNKDRIVEDIAIFRSMKKAGKSVVTLTDPNGLVCCRMYTGLATGIAGFSKNLLSGFGYSVTALLLYLFLTVYAWPLFVFWGGWKLLSGPLLVLLAMRAYIAAAAGQSVFKNWVLLLPQALVFQWIAWRSIYLFYTRKYEWKGRTIS
jgi:chlorobactene glucosyltransferase